MRRYVLFFFICILLIMVVGCSSTPPQQSSSSTKPAEEVVKKEAILYTGKPCVNRMVEQARRWSVDAMPLHIESKINAESIGHDGKATVWSGTFLSPTKAKAKIFTCSGSVLPDEPGQGVSGSPEMTASTAVPVFDPSLLGIDTDEAFNTAQEKGGKKLLEKDPKQPVLYSLDWDAKNNQLVWGVVYGTEVKNSKGIGIIDARTGKFLRASK